ncbi:MAG TPA: GTPase domain-containing protein [Pseudonocardiaceae bacterium]|nr:GTPase domain-containing protein [Pseudonocardiaceae bacterium]
MTVQIAVTVALVVLGYLISAFIRRRRGAPARPDPTAAPAVPTFRVVTLGLQGSGKTLLLTSMYRRLHTPRDRGYYVTVPQDQLVELNRWYEQVSDTGRDWPAGTLRNEMREFEFSVMAHTRDAAVPVVRIGYLEYPGELLTDPDAPGSTSQASLIESIRQADALIGIVDGLRVLQAYRRDARARFILQTTLDAMINSMLAASTPIAFVITKWDLLDELHADENTRLHIVRDVLMGVDGFADLVRIHSARRIIRLIPVTAVGHDFATLCEGVVRKKPDGEFQPGYVDVPLSAVVPDVMQQVEMALDRDTRAAVQAEAQRRARMRPAEALLAVGMFAAQRTGKVLLSTMGGGWLADAGLALFLDSYAPATQYDERRMAAMDEAERAADEVVQLRRRVLHGLRHQVSLLEARLPASRLGGVD